MKKRISNVYDYSDYRLILADDFAKRVANNYSYSLRGYSRDVNISVGHLSQVINRKKHFTSRTGESVFIRLGFQTKFIPSIDSIIY